jgi:hypothetical protein
MQTNAELKEGGCGPSWKPASVSVLFALSIAIMGNGGGGPRLKSLQEHAMTGALSHDAKHAEGKLERRKKRRMCPQVLSGILEAKEQRHVVTIHDLSLTGARVMNAPPFLELGDQMRLAIMIEGHAAHPFPCTVMHKNGNEAHLEIGVRFDPVDPEHSSGLEWYLRESRES